MKLKIFKNHHFQLKIEKIQVLDAIQALNILNLLRKHEISEIFIKFSSWIFMNIWENSYKIQEKIKSATLNHLNLFA